MESRKIQILEEYAKTTDDFSSPASIERWQEKVEAFLLQAFGMEFKQSFKDYDGGDKWRAFARQTGYLDALLCEVSDNSDSEQEKVSSDKKTTTRNSNSKKVFVVHGHDIEEKEKVSRFIEKVGLNAVILHEQANEGLTIVEKFELHSDVAFAVILLTPDDKAYSTHEPEKIKSRARQNVVLELGYFLGKLGRKRVCALYKGDTEVPSDIQGVLYIELDSAGAWKTKLAQEFVHAKLNIELTGLL